MSRSDIVPASFRLPAVPDPAGASRARPCVFLDPAGYFADGENATTAQAETSKGQVVQVSFILADPPAVSYMSVQCPGIEIADFATVPLVLCADGPLVLLAVTFIYYPTKPVCVRPRFPEYFLYKAGPGKPSLELIPCPHFYRPFPFRTDEIGIVHCGDDQFVIAVLEVNLTKGWNYDLHLFSRKSSVWITKQVTRDMSCDWDPAMFHNTSKVVTVGGGKLGWVDLWRGVLVCDVLRADADPLVSYVSLPDPMESNKDDFGDTCPRSIRDITCINDGSFKFVEMEFLDEGEGEGEGEDSPDAWTATVWKKKALSADWHMLHFIDVDDISVSTSHSDTFPELWDDKAMKPSLTKLMTASPTLSLLDDSVAYMMSKVNCDDPRAWMISIDMKTKEMVQMFPSALIGSSTSL